MSEYLDDVRRYRQDADENAVAAIVKHLGIALKSKDASIVACSSKNELTRVRDSWCKKKLCLTESDADIDKVLKEVCEAMKSDKKKKRVTFYYLVAEKYEKLATLT